MAVAVALYAIAGFLVAPPIVRHQLERRLAEALDRPVTVERVRINPFTLSAAVENLVVQERGAEPGADAPPLARFDSLSVNVATASLWRLAPVIQSVRLVRPQVRLVRFDDRRYNVQDLIDRATAAPAEPPPEEPATTPRFAVANIEVDDGRVEFDDRPEKTRHEITDLRIGVPFISSIPSQVDITVQPELRATVNGAPLGVAGATKPFKDTHETTISLELKDLQVAQYLEYVPVPLRIRVPSGRFDTRLTLSFATQGDRLDTFDVSGSAQLRDLAVQDANGAPLVAASSLAVDLAKLDLVNRAVHVARVALERPEVRVARGKDGAINLLSVVDTAAGAATPAQKPADAADAKPFSIRIDEAVVTGGTVHVEDAVPAKPFRSRLDALSAQVSALSLATDNADAAQVKVEFGIEPKGRFSYAGTLQPQPLHTEGDVALEGLAIAAFAPYYEPLVDVQVTGGAASLRGKVVVDATKEALQSTFKGDASVAGFASLDGPTKQDLLRWKQLAVTAIDFRLEPLAVGIGQVALADFYSRLIINPDGRLNLQGLVRDGGPAAKPAEGGKAAQAAQPPARDAPLPVRVGRIVLRNGRVNFSDYFIKPNYSADLLAVNGSVSEMNASTPGNVDLRARIGKSAPVQVAGRVNPFAREVFLDIDASARDVDLPAFTPYSVKYAGYGIERGKLSMNVKYRLENRQLQADNKLRLDQLTFGERVESPTATKLPVLLAVSLLKDRNGVIDLDVPISGSLDDPQFSLGGVIARAIGNLLTRIVTAPFALLGSMFGGKGGADLAWVEFDPGAATIGDAQAEKLRTLAKALEERPALKLDIAGRADPETDGEALKRVLLDRRLKAMKLAERTGAAAPAPKQAAKEKAPADGAAAAPKADDGALDDVRLEPADRDRLLAQLWRTGPDGKPRTDVPKDKEPPLDQMERALLEATQVPEDALQSLAGARAEAVKAWFIETGRIPGERVFVVAPRLGREGIKDDGKPTRVDFALK